MVKQSKDDSTPRGQGERNSVEPAPAPGERRRHPRAGWAEAKRLAALCDDALVLPEFANEADDELRW